MTGAGSDSYVDDGKKSELAICKWSVYSYLAGKGVGERVWGKEGEGENE